jgi:hypothetical protein
MFKKRRRFIENNNFSLRSLYGSVQVSGVPVCDVKLILTTSARP